MPVSQKVLKCSTGQEKCELTLSNMFGYKQKLEKEHESISYKITFSSLALIIAESLCHISKGKDFLSVFRYDSKTCCCDCEAKGQSMHFYLIICAFGDENKKQNIFKVDRKE